MTFKSASENLSHISRVASASTRPRANGRIDLIPSDAKEPEEYYNLIRDQYLAMSERFTSNQARLAELRQQGFNRKDHEEYAALAEQQTRLQTELTPLRHAVHAAGANAWGILFKEVARRVLDWDTFIKIENEVKALLGRPEYEIKKSAGRNTKESEKRRLRRSKFRKEHHNRGKAN